MLAPVRPLCLAAALLLAGPNAVYSGDACGLGERTVCLKFLPHLRLSCIKHIQHAVGQCARSKATERFGSHEAHCRIACAAGELAYQLDQRLRRYGVETVESSAAANVEWLNESKAFWQGPDTEGTVCSPDQFDAAKASCAAHCDMVAKRRDLEELQTLAAGGDFLALKQPRFACPPSELLSKLSRSVTSLLERLYPPGDQRRDGSAAE